MRTNRLMVACLTVVIAALCLSITLQTTASAAQSRKDRMQQNKQEHTKLWQRIKQLSQEEGSLTDILAGIDARVEDKETEIDQIQQQLDAAVERRDELCASLAQIEQDLSSNKQTIAKRARAIYMQGDMSYMELLFQSDGFSDLIDRVFFVQAVLEHDERLVVDAESLQSQLIERQRVIDSQISDIDTIRQRLEEQLAELEELKSRKQLDLEAINNDKTLAKRQADELEDENKRIAAELREIANSASGYQGKPWAGSFVKPVSGNITSGYGYRIHPVYKTKKMHTGVDISAPKGTTIKAAGDGKVIFTGTRRGYGKTVMVDHGGGRVTLYGHMSKITCDDGDHVKTGDKIGEVGSTGVSTGNHCHFEVRIDGQHVDPMKEI